MKTKHVLIGASLLLLGLIAGRFLIPSNAVDSHTEAAHTEEAAAAIWTCSMHPQIRQPNPGDCPICGMDLIPEITDATADLGPRELSMSESSRALADIQTVEIGRALAQTDVRLVGRLVYDETLEKSLTARFPARIEELYVNVTGERVEQGQPLANVYSAELLTAQRELITAYQRDPNGRLTAVAREKLRLWDLLPAQIDAVLVAGEAKDRFQLAAPVGGIVVSKNVKEGDYVKTGESLFKIVDLSQLWLELEAYESDLAWLRVGQSIAFTTEAFSGETFTGEIAFIEPEVNAKTRTVGVRANVPNKDHRLKPGMFARGAVTASVTADADPSLLVPATAVLRTGKRAVVYVEKPDTERPTYEGREIVLGPRAGDSFVVVDGLMAGERVVMNGAFKIDSALQIQAKPSMMNPEGGGQTPGHNHGDTAPTVAQPDHSKHAGMQKLEISKQITAEFLPHYFELQKTLAADDLVGSQAALKAMMGVTGHSGDVPELIHTMLNAADLDGIRRPHFETLSKLVIAAVKADASLVEGEAYLMNCPMVYSDRGADWLQEDAELVNPYFGAMMLHCGEVKEKIN
ncbi:MAG: efflux RND transporter periplasmic adaptor subunit [Opitutaceae bacterium]